MKSICYIVPERRGVVMGILGEYIAVDEATLDYMVELDNDALLQMIEDLSGDPANRRYGIDKLWDGLHFLLTGKSASYPVEDDPLSEAVVGVHVFNDEDEEADFVGCTENDELPAIIEALKQLDIEALRRNFNLEAFRQGHVYPDIWVDGDKENLFNELVVELQGLIRFYEEAAASGAHIVISIY